MKTGQLQQVHRCRSDRGHRSRVIAPVAVRVLVKLSVTDPMPALNALFVSHLSQQCNGSDLQAFEKAMSGTKSLAVTGADGRHFHDPAGAMPGFADRIRRFLARCVQVVSQACVIS